MNPVWNSFDSISFNRAGVGRTGAYIAIDSMLERMEQQKDVDLFNFIANMRMRRIAMVQTEVSCFVVILVARATVTHPPSCGRVERGLHCVEVKYCTCWFDLISNVVELRPPALGFIGT